MLFLCRPIQRGMGGPPIAVLIFAAPIEMLKIVDPLTDPTAPGASASDAFHLVIPSMPGYGF